MKIVQLLAVLALVTASGPLRATQKVDSLLHLLETHTAIDRAEVLWAVAYELFDIDNPKAHFYAERAYHEVWKKGDSLQIVKVGTTYAQLDRRMGNLDRSIEVGERLLPIARRNNYRLYVKKILNALGVAHVEKENLDLALGYNYESLRMRQEDGDSIEIAIAYGNVGWIHFRLDEMPVAIEFFLKEIDYLSNSTDSSLWRICYNNLASAYMGINDYANARKYFNAALSLDAGRFHSTFPGMYQACAIFFLYSGQLDSAEYFSKLAIFHGRRLMDRFQVALANVTLSRVYLVRRNLTGSSFHLAQADSLSSGSPFVQLQVLRQKARLFAESGEPRRALALTEKYWKSKDSIYHGRSMSRFRQIEVSHAQRENELKLQSQASILALKDESLAQHRTMLVIITVLLILVALLAFELYRAYRKKANINKLLDLRVVERTQELGQQRDFLQHLVDEERVHKQRIVSEVQGQVNTLKGLLHLVEKDPGRSQAIYLANANDVTNQIAGTVRRLTVDMDNKGQFPGH